MGLIRLGTTVNCYREKVILELGFESYVVIQINYGVGSGEWEKDVRLV